MTRYAIYFAPAAASAWWRFGAGWLGRDDLRNAALPQVQPPTFSPGEFAAITAEPRRYGFHATLKAPFTLREGIGEADICERLAALAATLRSAPLGPLMPIYLAEGYVALVPTRRHGGIDAIAAQCVKALDDLRAPLTPEQLARRQPDLLDERGRELLQAWGYPYVLERFRFHMTLTGFVELDVAGRVVPHVAPLAQRLERGEPLRLDRLCLFREAAPGAPFMRVHDEVLAS